MRAELSVRSRMWVGGFELAVMGGHLRLDRFDGALLQAVNQDAKPGGSGC